MNEPGLSSGGMDLDECYRILELEPGATQADLKQAYRDLIKVWHPDRFPGDERFKRSAGAKTRQLNEAFATLNDFITSGARIPISKEVIEEPPIIPTVSTPSRPYFWAEHPLGTSPPPSGNGVGWHAWLNEALPRDMGSIWRRLQAAFSTVFLMLFVGHYVMVYEDNLWLEQARAFAPPLITNSGNAVFYLLTDSVGYAATSWVAFGSVIGPALIAAFRSILILAGRRAINRRFVASLMGLMILGILVVSNAAKIESKSNAAKVEELHQTFSQSAAICYSRASTGRYIFWDPIMPDRKAETAGSGGLRALKAIFPFTIFAPK
jgi:DnaJ domain